MLTWGSPGKHPLPYLERLLDRRRASCCFLRPTVQTLYKTSVTCYFVNDPVNWQAISALAFQLDRLGPKCFNSYRLFMIFDEAINQMRLEEDED